MKSITEHHNKMFAELSPDIVEKGVKHLKSILTLETVEQIKEDYAKDPDTWWAAEHFGWGMAIRNSLRDHVCLDKELPTQNWDEYYVRLVEITCGLVKNEL